MSSSAILEGIKFEEKLLAVGSESEKILKTYICGHHD